MAAIVFWASVTVAVYVYAGYPLVLRLLRILLRHNEIDRGPYWPAVSLLIPAHNEARVIREKIQNSLALDYPQDRMEIVIASDGSTDRTTGIARQFDDRKRIRVFEYTKNRGKVTTMNETVPELKGEIVVFSDASAMLAPDAIQQLVWNFRDSSVGAVSGIYQVRMAEHSATGVSEDLYWKYETFLRLQESALDSVLGGHGHLYAIRKRLYPFPPKDTINDDYVIAIRVVASGYRAVSEPKAVGWEHAAEMAGFKRRVRLMAGNIQQLRELPHLLRRPLPLFFFISHKVGRLVVPFAMLAALISSALLLTHPVYRALCAGQIVLYLMAGAGAVFPLRLRILRLSYYFALINIATFVGVYYALRSQRRMAWK